jgi:hypothetical protein
VPSFVFASAQEAVGGLFARGGCRQGRTGVSAWLLLGAMQRSLRAVLFRAAFPKCLAAAWRGVCLCARSKGCPTQCHTACACVLCVCCQCVRGITHAHCVCVCFVRVLSMCAGNTAVDRQPNVRLAHPLGGGGVRRSCPRFSVANSLRQSFSASACLHAHCYAGGTHADVCMALFTRPASGARECACVCRWGVVSGLVQLYAAAAALAWGSMWALQSRRTHCTLPLSR